MNEFLPKKIIVVFEDGSEQELENIKYYHTDISEYPDKTLIRVNLETVTRYTDSALEALTWTGDNENL